MVTRRMRQATTATYTLEGLGCTIFVFSYTFTVYTA